MSSQRASDEATFEFGPLLETALPRDATAPQAGQGQLFAFRGRRGDLVKVLSWDGQGLCLYAKRMEKGRFVWPQPKHGAVSLTAAQLSMLLEGIACRCGHGVRKVQKFENRATWIVRVYNASA